MLELHPAADGMLARLRLPGGRVSGTQLEAIADLAARGNGIVELTARANVQVRGLPAGDGGGPALAVAAAPASAVTPAPALAVTATPALAVTAAPALPGKPLDGLAAPLAAVGLLPSPAHERVRNVLASPLGGRHPAAVLAADEIVAALDRGLCAAPALAELPGRVRFLVEDGSGALAGLAHDFALVPAPGAGVALLVDGVDSARRAAEEESAASLALGAARAFLAALREHEGAWSVGELPGGAADVIARLDEPRSAPGGAARGAAAVGGAGRAAAGSSLRWPALPPAPLPPGSTSQRDGRVALTALAPLGRLSGGQLRGLAALAPEVRVSPWRTVTVLDLREADAAEVERELRDLGLVVEGDSGWARLSACAGLGACGSARADVRAAATARAAVRAPGAPAEHWAACPRRCGELPGTPVAVAVLDSGVAVRDGERETVVSDVDAALALLGRHAVIGDERDGATTCRRGAP